MEDEGKQPQSFGNGPQRNQHPRPFFYVQPPSQPYFLYHHWQLNNPYSHYGLPGGFNFPRPYVHPYQYMQYPGFVFPPAPLYPMDHRRTFEPRFHGPPWSDAPRQPCQPYPQGRRETACSEAQTDPSDAITKLIECLDKFRGGGGGGGGAEMQVGERELDSGVASQSSGMFSPGMEKKSEEPGQGLPSGADGGRLEAPAVFSDSTTAVYDAESSQRSLDPLSPQASWAGGMEEELPLDTSSVHEDGGRKSEHPATDEPFIPIPEVTDVQPDTLATSRNDDDLLKVDPAPHLTPSVPSVSSDQPELPADATAETERQKSDGNYQILRLPFDSFLPGDAGDAARLSSPAASYFYNYLSMHATRERMSVLSPSLDELSSREEMFSTDLDDSDLFPKHVYAGRRPAEVSGSSQATEDIEEAWPPGAKKSSCSCCGKSLARAASRSKVHTSKMYADDDGGDSEEDGRYGGGCEPPVRAAARKHSGVRKTHPVPPRHAAKTWYKRGQYKDGVDQEEGHNPRKQELLDGETSGELQCRTCRGKSPSSIRSRVGPDLQNVDSSCRQTLQGGPDPGGAGPVGGRRADAPQETSHASTATRDGRPEEGDVPPAQRRRRRAPAAALGKRLCDERIQMLTDRLWSEAC
ncbi:bucky ball-like isoform X2 [Antennarius striatus]|uniref:bucky ball-like isoform X2 n=1 Tax=Antennarius striatus TaxID=241820 RepID=UPI0035B46893